MGREIRMVPPNWQHPKDERGHAQPMHNSNIHDRFADWLENFDRIRRGELTDLERECYADPKEHPEGPLLAWLNDEGYIPDPKYFVPWKPEEATWFQMWETVSEGTPVTPAFATKAELVDWLVEKGESYGTRYCKRHSREAAQAFVDDGWVPSMIMMQKSDGSREIHMGVDAALALKKDTH